MSKLFCDHLFVKMALQIQYAWTTKRIIEEVLDVKDNEYRYTISTHISRISLVKYEP